MGLVSKAVLRGKISQVLHASTVMSNELAKVNLRVHRHKCEIYMPTSAPSPAGFDNIPVVPDRDLCVVAGQPIVQANDQRAQWCHQPTFALKQLKLRATAGACRIEYLL